MWKNWKAYNWIKTIVRTIFWIFATIITISCWIYVYINKSVNDMIAEEDKMISERTEILKNRFSIAWELNESETIDDASNIRYYFQENDKTILINKNGLYCYVIDWKTYYWTKWILIRDYDWYIDLVKYSNYDEYELSYTLKLIKIDPNKWNFFSNPSNYKISNTYFFDDYYKENVQKSGDILVWPNWAYYIWDYNDNLIPDGKWIMHYFWTDISKQVKITDNLILDVDESCWYNSAWFIYSWEWNNFKQEWHWEYYSYSIWWNRVNYLSWIFVNWEPLIYDIYWYQKINTNWWNFISDKNSYKLNAYLKENEESWTKEQHLTTIDWIPYTIITDPNINSGNKVYYYNNDKGITTTENPDWIWWMISELDSIEPVLSWGKLYYWGKAIYSWDIKYIDWKPIKSGNWILSFNTCNTAYLSWNGRQQQPNYSWDNKANYRWYWEYVWNCLPNITWQKWYFNYSDTNYEFSWELYDNNNSYYKWKINKEGYYEWKWFRKDADLEYYSGNRNKEWNYEWYWVYRLYNEVKTWWNFVDNEENYEIIYELSWYWDKWEYVGKIKWKKWLKDI